MAREYFCAYHSYLEAAEQLSDAETGRLFRACLQYSRTGLAPPLSGNERFVFPSLREQIDRDSRRYAQFVEKQTENGKKGGRPKKSPPPGPGQNPDLWEETQKSLREGEREG